MKRSKKRVYLILILVIILIVGLVILLVRYINSPQQGSINNNLPPTKITKSNFDLTPINVNGHYISFNYPAAFSTQSSNNPAALESYLYKYVDQPESWLLSVTVNKLSPANLMSDSNYAIRKDNPSQYQLTSEAIGNKTFYIMTDKSTGSFSKVAFIQNGDMSTDISLLGSDASGLYNLQATFNMVLNSFQWKQ